MKSSIQMLALFALAILMSARPVVADGEGQADYDKAIALKVKAKTTKDYDDVVNLCESAIKKGLDAETKKLAEEMIKNTLSEICTQLSDEVLKMARSGQGTWRFKRRQATVRIEKYLEKNKDDGKILFRLAKLQFLPGGDQTKARQALNRAIDSGALGDESSDALMMKGVLAKNPKEREEAFEKAIKQDPNNVKNLRMRAQYYFDVKQFDKAEVDFRKLAELKKDDISYKQALVKTLLNQAKPSKLNEAIKLLGKLIESDKDNLELYLERARAYGRLRDTDKEIADLSVIIKKDPRHIEALLMRGYAHLGKEKIAEAKKDLEAIIKVNQYNFPRFILEAQIAAHEKNYPLAIKNLQNIIRSVAPQARNNFRLQLALYYRGDKQFNKALETYEEILSSDPANIGAILARADTTLGMGNHEQAIADYETLMEQVLDDRQKEHVWNNLAWMLATSPNDKLRNGKRAIEIAKKACDLTEYKEAYILSTLASGYAEVGDFQTAIKWSTKAVELAKKNPTRDSQVEDLQKELDSYKKKKPWRELQEDKDKSGSKKKDDKDDFDF